MRWLVTEAVGTSLGDSQKFMQGKLSEIDIRSILQLIELGQRTGELFVEAPMPLASRSTLGRLASGGEMRLPRPPEKHWFVFFVSGQIVYAADAEANLQRLTDYLWRYRVERPLDRLSVPAIASINAPEYGYLWALLENHLLTPAQGRSIIQGMICETLFDVLSLHQGSFIFELGPPLSPQLGSLEIAPLLARIVKQVQEWKQFHPWIQSPDQCPLIVDRPTLQATLTPATFRLIDQYANGKVSIRQIARHLGRDILTVARAIYPYVQRGMIQLTFQPNQVELAMALAPASDGAHEAGTIGVATQPIQVVCIDDSSTVRSTVEEILNQAGYLATTIGNPIEALSLVFQIKPDIILCDIAMPELDGYEICAMLRRSTAFRQTPIVMLTGKDGFIDRVKAKMVGATDYLTKPFGGGELLMVVERYVGSGNEIGQGLPQSRPADSSPQSGAGSVKGKLEIEKTDQTSPSSTPFH
jgi:twitching motility two-component system response regulator PilG